MKCNDQIKNRIKRTYGQMNGVIKMVDTNESCEAIITQLKAIKASIEKTIGLVTASNLIQSIESKHLIDLKDMSEEISLIVKGM